MYKPAFPYLGNQVIITSGRVVAHSKDDMIFLFGKKGVGVSTPATFNIDADERVLITSPKIELGYQAEVYGQPILLGNSTVAQLRLLLDQLKALADGLVLMKSTELEVSIPKIVQAATVLSGQIPGIQSALSNGCLSQNTYTK